MKFLRSGLPLSFLLFAANPLVALAQGPGDAYRALALELAQAEAELHALEAETDIETLQRIFGFYIDKNMWTQAADLFTDDATFEWGGSGVYQGKAQILAYLQSLGAEGPQAGIINDHMQLMPVVHVAPDGQTAQGRWQHFSQEARHGVDHYWGSGVYENTYRFEDGVWKISGLQLYSTMRTPYDDGWGVTALPRSEPSTEVPPAAPPSVAYENYPAVFVPPFHYANPVTSPAPGPVAAADSVAGSVSPAQLAGQLATLEQRLGLVEDHAAVEQLHSAYGYYLARNQWDHLTGIFTPDGTIEIAQRGIYRNHEGIRRNLDLYGVQDELPGQLHNHMQFQPVIHIATNGQRALMRSRALSMMGTYEGASLWMGGIYENIFEKRDGVWMLHMDQVINTYFAPYDTGWKDLPWRPAPGVTEANPPDAPPSVYFEMYPRLSNLPDYHYGNPVTGRR